MSVKKIVSIAFLLLGCAPVNAFDGRLELEQRLFQSGQETDEINISQSSARLELEFFKDWNEGKDQITVEPFIRIDAEDSERSHADLRQFLWTHYEDNYEFSFGLGHVFWGVTESQHLVDIINQTDAVENIDGEDKLGQPMFHYSYLHDYGTFEAYVLPYFRERTFEGVNGRLNGGIVVDSNNAQYESSSGQSNVDLAARYSHTVGDWDVGLSWFNGTSREPDLIRLANFSNGTTQAYYPQIQQLSADIQLTTGGWLYKFEAIRRSFDDSIYQNFSALTIGTEYTLVGLFGSNKDLGLLAEYSWDERDDELLSLFQNDAFLGARLAFNDAHDSQVLFGVSNDLDNTGDRFVFLEGATRLASSLTLNIELRLFNSETDTSNLSRLDNDSFVQIGLEYFFSK